MNLFLFKLSLIKGFRKGFDSKICYMGFCFQYHGYICSIPNPNHLCQTSRQSILIQILAGSTDNELNLFLVNFSQDFLNLPIHLILKVSRFNNFVSRNPLYYFAETKFTIVCCQLQSDFRIFKGFTQCIFESIRCFIEFHYPVFDTHYLTI